MAITDADEAEVASYRYSPYGEMTITVGGTPQSSDPLGQHWGYAGRLFDEQMGLWFYRVRYLGSKRGRFVTRDPAGYVEGAVLYRYVANSPIQQRDPSGMAIPQGATYPTETRVSTPSEGAGVTAAELDEAAEEASDRWKARLELLNALQRGRFFGDFTRREIPVVLKKEEELKAAMAADSRARREAEAAAAELRENR